MFGKCINIDLSAMLKQVVNSSRIKIYLGFYFFMIFTYETFMICLRKDPIKKLYSSAVVMHLKSCRKHSDAKEKINAKSFTNQVRNDKFLALFFGTPYFNK